MSEKAVTYAPFGTTEMLTLSIDHVKQFVSNPTRSGKLPSTRDAVNFVMMCQAKQLNPYEGDAFLVGFDGKDGPKFTQITAHQALLKRAEANKAYDGMESGVIIERDGNVIEEQGDFVLKGDNLLGGWAKVFRKDKAHGDYSRLKLATYHSGKSRWNLDPEGMICKCAEADALRRAFPSTIGGLYIREEMSRVQDVTEDIEVSPAEGLKAKIADKVEPIPVEVPTKPVEAPTSDEPDEQVPEPTPIIPDATEALIEAIVAAKKDRKVSAIRYQNQCKELGIASGDLESATEEQLGKLLDGLSR